MIQGYNGIAATDFKHLVIVHPEAFGEDQESELLEPMIKGVRKNFKEIGEKKDIYEKASVLADSGFHSEENMKMLSKEKVDGYVADGRFRKRDPRFAIAVRHKDGIKKKRRVYKNKFTLRGRKKINIQWKLYCILHNIGKMYRYVPQLA